MKKGDRVVITGLPGVAGQISADDSKYIGRVGTIVDDHTPSWVRGEVRIFLVNIEDGNAWDEYWWPETSLETEKEDLPLTLMETTDE